MQPGDTVLGLSAVALLGLRFTSCDSPLALDPDTFDRQWRPGLFSRLEAAGSLMPEGAGRDDAAHLTIGDRAITVATDGRADGFSLPDLPSADVMAGQMAVYRLAGPELPPSHALPADLGVVSWLGGAPLSPLSLAELGAAAGRSREMFAATGAASPAVRAASLTFDGSSGQLTIRVNGGEHVVREAVTADGFVKLTLDGGDHSSNPRSADFDAALAGAAGSSLSQIRFDGAGANDKLVVESQSVPHFLAVAAPGAEVITQNIAVGGTLAIQAQSITVTGALQGRSVALDAMGWVDVQAAGRIDAMQTAVGGQIGVTADVFVNAGQLHADGRSGGQVIVQARNLLNAGLITADGTTPGTAGGLVHLGFTDSYIATTAALTSADGAQGGSVVTDGGVSGHLFSSGRQLATGSVHGGTIDLFGRDVVLAGATADASGETGGGSIHVGDDFQRLNPAAAGTQTVSVTSATTLRADATRMGNGGRVTVWSERQTTFDGSVSVRGGSGTGQGGLAEVSGKGDLTFAGKADAGAQAGKSGTLLLDPKNLVIADAPAGVFPQFDLIDPHPTAGGRFGTQVSVLSNGNVVVTNPNDNFGSGAAYLFDGVSGALISSLVGGNFNDQVGFAGTGNQSIIPLSNGNYLVLTRFWNGQRGAVTWGNGSTGVSGTVSDANSLVGSNTRDHVGGVLDPYGNFIPFITLLSNGNYVVSSSDWNGKRGAVTWGNGSTGISGTVSDANSLVGDLGDRVGGYYVLVGDKRGVFQKWMNGVTPLDNGNYVVLSPFWNGGGGRMPVPVNSRGAVTWGNGSTGVSGIVSAANSLVGSNPYDQVGYPNYAYSSSIIPLSNGNYVVQSTRWNKYRGAVTWGNGNAPISGIVSEANSLVGSNPGDGSSNNPGDRVGYVTPLSNGNYVVSSSYGGRGAATWGNGTTGVTGTVSEANSLVGSKLGDRVGVVITPLNNGNYVVSSQYWNGGYPSGRGAVTWGNGSLGVSGVVSDINSLIGSNPGDQVGYVTLLSNGNYVVNSPNWNGARGASTWGNGSTGVRGAISETNSLVGGSPGDQVGEGWFGRVIPLSNSNYVVYSPQWNGARGAATWGNGNTGVSGTVSDANSLIGSNPGDQVGYAVPLSNGNYVVESPYWSGGYANGLGAVTWGDGSTGIRGIVSEANSLVGSQPGDQVGEAYTYGAGVTLLSNGNYVVGSPLWNDKRGAVTWGNGSMGTSGAISDANSLVGSDPKDFLGSSVTRLSNGNYVVTSSYGGRGAVTWENGNTPASGTVSDANSLVGTIPGDAVGFNGGGPSIIALRNGNYVIESGAWNGGRGAVTWGNGSTGTSGTVSDANSLVFSSPGGPMPTTTVSLTLLSNGNYVVANPSWNGQHGALTWVSGTTGQTLDGKGVITTQNSLVGQAPNAGLRPLLLENPVAQTFLASFSTEASGRVTAGLADPHLLTYSVGQSQTVTITPAFLTRTLANGTAIVLQASNDITVNSAITVNAGGNGAALTLQAGRSVLLNAPISTDNGALNLIANDQVSNGVADSQRDPGSAVIRMAGGTFLNTGAGALTAELRDGLGLTNRDSGAITLQTVTAASVSVVNNGPSAGSDVNLGRLTTSGAQTYANPNGTTIVTGNLTATDNPITFNHSVVLNAGLSLSAGSSTVNFAGGTVSRSPGLVTVAGGVVLPGATTLTATLNGTDPGSYSQLAASGLINVGGSTLSLVLGFEPPLGSTFEVLTNAGTGPITGTFNGLDEGAVFTQGGYQFQITYQGGTGGNSVVVTRLA